MSSGDVIVDICRHGGDSPCWIVYEFRKRMRFTRYEIQDGSPAKLQDGERAMGTTLQGAFEVFLFQEQGTF